MSQKIIFGQGSFDSIGSIVNDLHIHAPLIVTGGASYQLSGANREIEKSFNASAKGLYFSVSTKLPETQEVERGLEFFKKGNFDALIAIGGGCVMDTAKLIRYLAVQRIDTEDAINNPVQKPDAANIPLIVIPTTAGSGAEATHFSVLYKGKTKFSIANTGILPDIAVVDPNLTLSCLPRLTAISGLDAMSQGIESYWSVNATEESRGYAEHAIRLSLEALIPAIRENKITSKVNLSRAALLAGQAINISKTTAPHALSYPLTACFGIPHGHAVALTLGDFFKLAGEITDADCNHPQGSLFVQTTIKELCKLLQAQDPDTARQKIRNLVAGTGLENQLTRLGVSEKEFDQIVDDVNLERLSNHPQKLTTERLRSILKNCL